jgi:hypothetical protein
MADTTGRLANIIAELINDAIEFSHKFVSMNRTVVDLIKKFVRKPDASPTTTPPRDGNKLTATAAAAKVLGENGGAMPCLEMVAEMARKRYWVSPNGKTPDRTLGAAIGVEISKKGELARFKKVAPGKFALSAAGRHQFNENQTPQAQTAPVAFRCRSKHADAEVKLVA